MHPFGRPGLILILAAVALAPGPFGRASGASSEGAQGVIVRFRSGVDSDVAADGIQASLGVRVRYRYRHAISGFAADLTAAQIEALRHDSRVAAIEPDGELHVADLPDGATRAKPASIISTLKHHQVVPTGVSWIGTLSSPTAHIGHSGPALNINVAVLDTGIDPGHPDLNVVGGYSVLKGNYTDNNGHGTHVAGIIGAKDNGIGVVGVAPGCRLWAVRALDQKGFGTFSQAIAGLEWILSNRSEIDLINMSVASKPGQDSPAFQTAIEACLTANLPIIAAAGNNGDEASTVFPGGYAGVIDVAALADFEGFPGHPSGIHTVGGHKYEDQSFAFFSNYGPKIDLVAPGVEILSTYKHGGYAYDTGTSMAAPHVTGAAALYLVNHPGAAPSEIRDALRALGTVFDPPSDPDGSADPALNTSTL